MENKEDKNIGPIIGTLVIVIVLFAAAIYVFATHVNRQEAMSDSDDVQSLKDDLNNSIK